MFETIQLAPPDAILGLNEAFHGDTREGKINLTAGVYKDDSGATPILRCVKAAETQLDQEEKTKSYLGIDGLPRFRELVPQLLLGEGHSIITDQRIATIQTPGGTGALKVAADLIRTQLPAASIWCSSPTWANHPSIFMRAGLDVNSYAYLDSSGTKLDANAMLESLNSIPAGDAICLHACCHNPTGVDPTPDEWRQIADVVKQRNLIPLMDFAYQGFGEGLEEDSAAFRLFADTGIDMLVCSSYSKNFGLYGERVGALSLISADSDITKRVLSQAKTCVRTNYSNPPKHGAAIVARILETESLRNDWETELAEMRDRINGVRKQFVQSLQSKAPNHDFSHVGIQKGMFSFSGLSPLQVDQLRTEHAIYIVGSGRINVAGITSDNLDRLTDAIAQVL